jgi:hypothetical protein
MAAAWVKRHKLIILRAVAVAVFCLLLRLLVPGALHIRARLQIFVQAHLVEGQGKMEQLLAVGIMTTVNHQVLEAVAVLVVLQLMKMHFLRVVVLHLVVQVAEAVDT